MRPNFALNLSHDGIVLLHRSLRGNWTVVGEIALDDQNFRENLSFLRSTAVGLEGKGFGTKLIIPDSQILYRTVTAPGPYEDERVEQIKAALVGLTPYEVADLSFDWRVTGGAVQVAVVAKETLDEAEGFAVDHRFNPLSFVAKLADENGLWEPFFGRTDYAVSMLGIDADVRDIPAEKPAVASDQVDGAGSQGASDDTNSIFAADFEGDFEDAGHADADGAQDPSASAEKTPPAFASRRRTSVLSEGGTRARPLDRIAARMVIGSEAAIDRRSAGKTAGRGAGQAGDAGSFGAGAAKTGFAGRLLGQFRTSRAGLVAAVRLRNRKTERSALPIAQSPVDVAAAAVSENQPLPASRSARLIRKAAAATGSVGLSAARWFATQPGVIFSAAALLVVISIVVGFWLVFGGVDNSQTPSQGEIVNAADGGTQDHGVNADNRVHPRPGDLDTSVTVTAANSALSPVDLANERPVPRSKFEAGNDPDAGQPDTVSPITALSDAERADIRAAGLPEPTLEESVDTEGAANLLPLLGIEQLALLYRDSNILQGVQPYSPPETNKVRDDIFVPGIDRDLQAADASALPRIYTHQSDLPFGLVLSPPAATQTYDFDDRGLVRATTDGAVAPSGITVFLGKPAKFPPPKPDRDVLVPVSDLAAFRPVARPNDLKTGADAIFVQGHLTIAQLRAKKPKPRPKSEQILLAAADDAATELAVARAPQPPKRPADFAQTVAKAQKLLVAATAGQTPDTTAALIIPTHANVAKLATNTNALNRSALNLIGVYGTSSDRRALLRLPSGLYVKVKIGDRIDGGRVASISESSLNYVKSGRARVLKIPNGA